MDSNGLIPRDRLLTLPGARRESGLSLRQIRRGSADGELPVYQIGGWARVRWGDLLDWIERKRVRVHDADKAQVQCGPHFAPTTESDRDGTDPTDKGAARQMPAPASTGPPAEHLRAFLDSLSQLVAERVLADLREAGRLCGDPEPVGEGAPRTDRVRGAHTIEETLGGYASAKDRSEGLQE